MSTQQTFDIVMESWQVPNEAALLDWVRGMVWGEVETTERNFNITNARRIESIDGVGVYYNFGADYYFFTDETED